MWREIALAFLEALAVSERESRREDSGPRVEGPEAQRVWYRTRDGNADYGFSIERLAGGSHRVYITVQPTYASRSTHPRRTHRLVEGGRAYVCWSGPIRTAAEARMVAAAWADATQRYIRTGARF